MLGLKIQDIACGCLHTYAERVVRAYELRLRRQRGLSEDSEGGLPGSELEGGVRQRRAMRRSFPGAGGTGDGVDYSFSGKAERPVARRLYLVVNNIDGVNVSFCGDVEGFFIIGREGGRGGLCTRIFDWVV